MNNQETTKVTFKTKFLIGTVDNEPIYLSAPSWDCGWYWGFGYLGNNNCHYHFSGLDKNKDLHTAIKEHFDTINIRESQLWEFAELMSTFYKLKTATEVLRGSAGLTSNPIKGVIQNDDEIKRINTIVMPYLFNAIHNILNNNKGNKEILDEIVSLNLEGDTRKVVLYMNDNNIKPDDLKELKSISKADYYIIHLKYWELFHAAKK